MIRIQRVYDEITKEKEWEPSKDSKERNLRKKFDFLMGNVMLRDPDSYKKNSANEVPKPEAPVIKSLLMASLDRKSIISKWFNGSLDLSVSENTVQLFTQVKEQIERVYRDGLTDEVTVDEWLATINAAIDYTNAQKVIEIKCRLDDLRAAAKPLNHTIGLGDIIQEHEDGSRKYLLRGDREINQKIEEKTIDQIMDHVSSEKDYHDILHILIAKFIDHALSASYGDILKYAEVKALNDDDVDGIKNNAKNSIGSSSDYLQRFRNICEYLKHRPEIVKDIENNAGTTGLLEFFHMAR